MVEDERAKTGDVELSSEEERFEPEEEEVRFWLSDEHFEPSPLPRIWFGFLRFLDTVTFPIRQRIEWAARDFVELAYTKHCIIWFAVFIFLSIYFGAMIHEGLHVLTAYIIGEVPLSIKLNSDLYGPLAPVFEYTSKGFISVGAMGAGNPGYAMVMIPSNSMLARSLIALVPNIVLFTLGFIWLRKGLQEKRPGWFAVGLMFTCANLEMFIPGLYTDAYTTSKYLASLLSIRGNNEGLFTWLVAFSVFLFSYFLSRAYDKWQRGMKEKSGRDGQETAEGLPVTDPKARKVKLRKVFGANGR